MYLRRLRLRGVKGFRIDVPEDRGPLPDSTRKRMLIQGAPGSGKTTILECIRLLWEAFGEWIDRGTRGGERLRRASTTGTEQALRRAELAAMELGDFPVAGQRTWIGMGQEDAWHDLKREYPDANFAGQYHDGRASEQ